MTRAHRLLYLRSFARQPLRTVLTVLAVGAGVSLVVAVLFEVRSLKASLDEFSRELAGPAAVQVVGPGSRAGIDEAVARRIGRIEGVAAAVPVVRVVALAAGDRAGKVPVVVLGVACGPMVSACPTGRAPVAGSKLLTRLGSDASLHTDVGAVRLARAPSAAVGRLADGRALVLPLTEAQRVFSRQGRVDVVYVTPAANTSVRELRARLARALPPSVDVIGRGEALPWTKRTFPLIPLLELVGLLSLTIGAMLVHNVVALSLQERRRELAIAMAVGAGPRTVVGGALVEAGLLGTAGGAVGMIGGLLLARLLLRPLSHDVERVTGLAVRLHADPAVLVFGLAVGTVAAVVAAWAPARRAASADVTAALQDTESSAGLVSPTGPLRAGLYVGVGLAAVLIGHLAQRRGALEPHLALLGEVAFVTAVLFLFLGCGALAPLVVRATLGLVRPGAARLGLANLVRDPRRTSTLAAAVGAAVGIACVVASLIGAARDASSVAIAKTLDGRVSVAAGSDDWGNVEANLSPATVTRLLGVPGVDRADRVVSFAAVDAAGRVLHVGAAEHTPYGYGVVRGPGWQVLRRGRIGIGAPLARRNGLRPGSTLRLRTPTGEAALTVGVVWNDPTLDGIAAKVPMPLLTRLWGATPPSAVYLVPTRGVSVDELARRVRTSPATRGLDVEAPGQVATRFAREVERFISPFRQVQQGMLVVALVATLTTMLLVGVARRRELGVLSALGMSPSTLTRMVLSEALGIGVVGALLGALASVAVFEALREIVPIVVGFGVPFRVDAVAPVLSGLAAVVVVLIGAIWPAWRAARVEVVTALRYE